MVEGLSDMVMHALTCSVCCGCWRWRWRPLFPLGLYIVQWRCKVNLAIRLYD